MIFDDFLNNYKTLKEHSKSCHFKDMKNPIDGVVYPFICDDIPKDVESELFEKLSLINDKKIENATLFMRMTKKDTACPHVAHTDTVMGSKSFMLYLHDHPMSGTSFLRHADSGITYQPESEEFQELIQKDTNNIDKWVRCGSVPAKENRAVIFDSSLIHCAEPVGGFGATQETARIVLTCFYD